MRESVRDWISITLKSVVFVVGLILTLAALVDILVEGTWFVRGGSALETFEQSPGLVLLLGLALAVTPLALAFRDAVRAARNRRPGEP